MPRSDKADMERRIAAASPADKLRGYFFKRVIDLVGQRVSADAANRVLASLRSEGYSALTNYPLSEFLRLLYAAVDELEPRMGAEAAFRACGASAVDAFASSAAGLAIFGVISAFGDPARLASQVNLAYATGVTYGKREFRQTGPCCGILRYHNDCAPPAYHEGVILRALEAIGYRARFRRIEKSVTEVDFEVSWEPLKK